MPHFNAGFYISQSIFSYISHALGKITFQGEQDDVTAHVCTHNHTFFFRRLCVASIWQLNPSHFDILSLITFSQNFNQGWETEIPLKSPSYWVQLPHIWWKKPMQIPSGRALIPRYLFKNIRLYFTTLHMKIYYS